MNEIPQRKIRAVIFDMDGLMIDSESIYWAVGRDIARGYGKQVSDETLGRMMGRSPLDSVELFCRELNISEDPRQLLARRDAEVFARFSRDVQAMPGMREALDKFRPKYKLAIATSATRRFVDLVMERLQIRDYFEVLQTSEDVLEGKPAPEIYLKAMSKLGVVPAGSVVLEDSSNGALAGKRSGAYTIAVPSQYTRLQDFSFVDFRAGDLRQAAAHVAAIDFPGGSA